MIQQHIRGSTITIEDSRTRHTVVRLTEGQAAKKPGMTQRHSCQRAFVL